MLVVIAASTGCAGGWSTPSPQLAVFCAPAPGTSFEADSTISCETVGTRGGSLATWEWSDGSNDEGVVVSHVYGRPGSFVVTATVGSEVAKATVGLDGLETKRGRVPVTLRGSGEPDNSARVTVEITDRLLLATVEFLPPSDALVVWVGPNGTRTRPGGTPLMMRGPLQSGTHEIRVWIERDLTDHVPPRIETESDFEMQLEYDYTGDYWNGPGLLRSS